MRSLIFPHFDIVSGSNNGIPLQYHHEFYYQDASAANHTFGHSEVRAGFAMIDYAISPRLRFSGGLRGRSCRHLHRRCKI